MAWHTALSHTATSDVSKDWTHKHKDRSVRVYKMAEESRQ